MRSMLVSSLLLATACRVGIASPAASRAPGSPLPASDAASVGASEAATSDAPGAHSPAAAEAEAPAPWRVPAASGFELPVGPPDGAGYYDAQPFGRNAHLGSDWNGTGGGATDLGDPVTAAAAGIVSFAGDVGGGWGNVVVLTHFLPTGEVVETLYGHLAQTDVQTGQIVARRDALGTIGDAGGLYSPHLHFEVRTTPGLGIGPGYASDPEGWTDPTAFVSAHP